MYLLFCSPKYKAMVIVKRIKTLDEMDHSTIYSRWEADRQILELTRQLKELTQ